MHSDQVQIDVTAATALIRAQFPRFAAEKIEALQTAGTVNAIFRIGSAYAARFPLRSMAPEERSMQLSREAAAMEELALYCPVPCPRPIAIGAPGPNYPMQWLVQTWIVGQTASPDGLSQSNEFSLDLAELIRSLRTANLKGRQFSGRGRGGTLRDHDEWMEVCFTNSETLLDVSRLRQMWSVLRELPPPETMVMSHKDLIPANLLISGKRLVGVLDGGSFGPADPALDLVAGWHLLDRARRTVFREAIEATDLEWQRGAAWAFEQAMGLVWYYQDTNPTMSALGRSTISRLLDDLAV